MTVLLDSAAPPSKNLAARPTQLTHTVGISQPYFYVSTKSAPAGKIDAGTEVALTSRHGRLCRVVTAQGLSVFTPCDGLQPLARQRSKVRATPVRRRAPKRSK